MKSLFSLFLLFCFYFVIGCGGAYDTPPAEERPQIDNGKINVEAYLFDAKIKQDGKPTTVRLFFFQTDSVIAIGGKGYLGKGALKGWLTEDSIKVFFPSTNEYVYESIGDLFSSFDCSGKLPKFDLMALFSNTPDQVLNDIEISIIKMNESKNRPKYQISFLNCPWNIEITYDRQEKGYRIRNFEFTDGNKTTLLAKRREYHDNREVKLSRFHIKTKPGSYRIIP